MINLGTGKCKLVQPFLRIILTNALKGLVNYAFWQITFRAGVVGNLMATPSLYILKMYIVSLLFIVILKELECTSIRDLKNIYGLVILQT